jgi:hypothetical protein
MHTKVFNHVELAGWVVRPAVQREVRVREAHGRKRSGVVKLSIKWSVSRTYMSYPPPPLHLGDNDRGVLS